MIVEIHGLEVFGRHGVGAEERERGQSFFIDVLLTVDEPGADTIEATFDYRRARDLVRAVNERERYNLLESLAAAAADALIAEPQVREATVTVRKPGVAWADWTAVTVSRS
jgi:7,8-dihydroneopterin aldolase/epimerase/oxygenase